MDVSVYFDDRQIICNNYVVIIILKVGYMDSKTFPVGFLFDLDGVLIDSEKEYSRIWRQVNCEFPCGVESLESMIKGCTLDKILEDHYPDLLVREKVVNRLYELEGKMRYDYTPGAFSLLTELQGRSLQTALVTSSNDVKMAHLDEELPDFRNFFDCIITADLISKSKPDPEGYLLASSKLGIPAKRCIVFEDSLQGVKAGFCSGAYVVGVAGTLSADVLEPYSDVVVDSLQKINVDYLLRIVDSRNDK